MSFSTNVLTMVGGTSQDMTLGRIIFIWIWIRWSEMVSGQEGLRYHTNSPNVMLGR